MRERDGISTHEPAQCAGTYCCLHNPSDHHMVDWPIHFRMDRRPVLVERICEHGTGHPDPDSLAWMASLVPPEHAAEVRSTMGIHGCDRCCRKEDDDIRTDGA